MRDQDWILNVETPAEFGDVFREMWLFLASGAFLGELEELGKAECMLFIQLPKTASMLCTACEPNPAGCLLKKIIVERSQALPFVRRRVLLCCDGRAG